MSGSDTIRALHMAIQTGKDAVNGADSGWQATTAYALNALVEPKIANGHYYKATIAGTSGATQPTFPTTGAGTVVDGTVTWTEQGKSQWTFIESISRKWKPARKRKATKELMGTMVKKRRAKRLCEHDTFTVDTEQYYDQIGILLTPTFGYPVTTTVSGAKQHVFNEGPNKPFVALRFFDGTNWWLAKNCMVNTAKFAQPEDDTPHASFELMCPPFTKMVAAAPTVPLALLFPQPMDWQDWLVKIAGSNYALPLSIEFDVKNNLKPLPLGTRTNAPGRFTEGDVDGTYSMKADYATDTGSLFESFRNNALPGALELEYKDLLTTIGSAQNPTLDIKYLAPTILDAEDDDSGASANSPIKGEAGLSIAAGNAITATLLNTTLGYDGVL